MLTLYHAPRSRSFRMLWLLEELAAPYTVETVSVRRSDGSGAPDPRNPHPHGKVPALRDGSEIVFETPAIALYLTDKFPAAGLGPCAGEPGRGAYLSWLSWSTGVFEPSLTAKFLNLQHIHGTFGWAPFDGVVAHLTRAVGERPYLLGERFSAADIAIGGSLQILLGRIVPENEILKAYVTRVTDPAGVPTGADEGRRLMGALVNLRRARKQKAREAAENKAAANRALHGTPKPARDAVQAETRRQRRAHDRHRLEE